MGSDGVSSSSSSSSELALPYFFPFLGIGSDPSFSSSSGDFSAFAIRARIPPGIPLRARAAAIRPIPSSSSDSSASPPTLARASFASSASICAATSASRLCISSSKPLVRAVTKPFSAALVPEKHWPAISTSWTNSRTSLTSALKLSAISKTPAKRSSRCSLDSEVPGVPAPFRLPDRITSTATPSWA